MFRLCRLMPLYVAALLATTACATGQAYRPAFHPETLKGPVERRPNEVLVLGTPHLSSLSQAFQPEMLTPLLDRLASWHPTQIAIENLSGLQCDAMRRFPSRYADTVKTYCSDPTTATQATGLDVPAANAEADRLLATWPASPSAEQRRHLAAVFLAAGERYSALVQWLRLPVRERHAGDRLTGILVDELNKLAVRRGESGLIAAALAARLGLERVWAVDDHTADLPDSDDPAERKAAGEAISGAWKNPDSAARRSADDNLVQKLAEPDGLLNLYRWNNRPAAAMQAYRADFGAALREPSPQQFGRGYVGYWETRNLRMVANIREVLGRYPGSRLLAIVGASHKGYYEAYLDMMHDATLVDAEAVLK